MSGKSTTFLREIDGVLWNTCYMSGCYWCALFCFRQILRFVSWAVVIAVLYFVFDRYSVSHFFLYASAERNSNFPDKYTLEKSNIVERLTATHRTGKPSRPYISTTTRAVGLLCAKHAYFACRSFLALYFVSVRDQLWPLCICLAMDRTQFRSSNMPGMPGTV